MSNHNEKISPTEFELNDKTEPGLQPSTSEFTGKQTSRSVWVLLLTLVFVAVLVVFWLPDRINQQPELSQPASEATAVSPEPAAVAKKEDSRDEETSPWTEAQLAKMRKQAQDALASLLEAQEILEDMGVEHWAAEDFAHARDTATAGDADYRERQFVEATRIYQQGQAEFQAIIDRAPEVLEEHLSVARQAIDDGDGASADAALLVAASIEPDSAELYELTQRAANLEQFLSLVTQAEEAELSGKLAQAEKLLQQAVTLDSHSERARSELDRVARAYVTQRFNREMSAGYASLDKNQFEPARSAFRRAAQLIAGSSVAASALDDVDSAETADRLFILQQRGEDFVNQEKWADALEAFSQALQIDNNLLFAQQGLNQTRDRARLDKHFRNIIDEPGRLSDQEVADATAQLLRQASAIKPRGPLLTQQLEQLEKVLKIANTPIVITLQSDMETEVTLRKVARLGRFEQRELNLRPGTYVAVGTRDGYRDVRRTFSINHDSEPPTVVIACTDPI
jgi:tetratricopeptide (TPR) repeat protein